MAPSSFTRFARVLGTTSPAFKWRMYVGIMPTPWLSWPIRLARTRCSATRSASEAALPPAFTIALVKRRRLSAVDRTRFLPDLRSRPGAVYPAILLRDSRSPDGGLRGPGRRHKIAGPHVQGGLEKGRGG